MADPMTDRFETYEPDEEDHVWDEEADDRDPRPRVLWGRIAILGGVVVLAFLLGRATSSGGAPAGDLDKARERVEALEAENAALKTEIAALEAEPAAETDDGAAEEDDEAEASEPEDRTYTVKPGDSLTTIAQTLYGDASLDDFLAEANGIADPTKLSVGQVLRIPPDPKEG